MSVDCQHACEGDDVIEDDGPGWEMELALEELRWLESLDKSSGVAARYIGYADLMRPDAAETLDRVAQIERCVGRCMPPLEN